MYTNESDVAKKAEQMLEASLRSKTATFKDHVNRAENDQTLKDATAKASVKKYGTKRRGNQKVFMRRLSIRMARHGFIQHFGVNTIRSGGTRTRHRPQETTYGFKSHVMKMKAQPFINSAVNGSGVRDFVLNEVMRIRSEEIMVNVRSIMENR